ncbi:hypothetical protein GQ43DRAFT_282955 [Delitschia confertaspora ATCC 74209]|uniref:Uncharacterized protein n=1 Tax=Delitschia confertaspora ATCC 74209 TaxID=1513339 RepID=A0A9P4JAM4_9PLEO|nr:hypothetical protein GQ43DRAFT_282955 [Delitschia confertaspora ATCC 74209]
MNSYNQHPQGYPTSGNTTSVAGNPPPYGAPQQQIYQTPAPSTQSQWAAPPQNTAAIQQQQQQRQWDQSPQQNCGQALPTQQQAAPSYNPGTYGVMPGAYNQGQASNAPPHQPSAPPSANSTYPSYPSQFQPHQQDKPLPSPPKPQGFAAAVHQQQQQQQQQQQSPQSWSQQSGYVTPQSPQSYHSTQQDTSFTSQTQQGEFNIQGQQGGFQQSQQGPFQNQGVQQQQLYINGAPPPAPSTSGMAYFHPAQKRPTSIYASDQANQIVSPISSTQPSNTALSPGQQHPAYIPSSLSGQGVQAYIPSNSNPLPGVYVPPPPDVAGWQQATHAPLEPGRSKFKYTKYQSQEPQDLQGGIGMQPPQQGIQQQPQFGQSQPHQTPPQFGQPVQNYFQPQSDMGQQGRFGPPIQSQQAQDGQPSIIPNQFHQPQLPQQQPQQKSQQQFGHVFEQNPVQQPTQQFQVQSANQWNTSLPAHQGYGHPQQQNMSASYDGQQPPNLQTWQPGHVVQSSTVGHSPHGVQDEAIQAPKPINGHSQTTPPSFVNAHNPSPQTHTVSPVQQRQSVHFEPGQTSTRLGRTSSVSSIALGALRQQGNIRTGTVLPQAPSPPPLPEEANALRSGGPSDWEHFGSVDEEIDDMEMFGAKKEEKEEVEAPQFDSVELPVPSPPSSVREWPTPPASASATASMGQQRGDNYVPTPPPESPLPTVAARTQPQQFVMDESIVNSQSPKSMQSSQPVLPPEGFIMDGGWDASKQSISTQQNQNASSLNSFVIDDGERSQAFQANKPPLIKTESSTSFLTDDSGWEAAQETPTQRTGGGIAITQGPDHAAELRTKDEAYARLQADAQREKVELKAGIEKAKADAEREKLELRSQIERARVDAEVAKSRFETDQRGWAEQTEQLRAEAEKLKSDITTKDSDLKESNRTLERLKEDIEGKEKTIAAQDMTIRDLRKQLQEIPPPQPRELIPDLDPWYAASLDRFITMLRQEASEPALEDKIKVFTTFLATESHVRGLEYHSATPPAPASVSPAVNPVSAIEPESAGISRISSIKSSKQQGLHVTTPAQSFSVEEGEYSPGGRPILRKESIVRSDASLPTQQSIIASPRYEEGVPQAGFQQDLSHLIRNRTDGMPPGTGNSAGSGARSSIGGVNSAIFTQSATIITPSSTGDDFDRIIQSPSEQPTKPQYQPYVPGRSDHRHSLSIASASFPSPINSKHDEIFFEEVEPQSASKSTSRPRTSTLATEDIPIPAPLSVKTSTTQLKTKKPDSTLASLLPNKIVHPAPNLRLQPLRQKALSIPSISTSIQPLLQTFDKSAAVLRAKNDRERQKRQEESETRATQLFDDNEISYADIGAIEDEFREREAARKEEEIRGEYNGFVREVFERCYGGIVEEIGVLGEVQREVEGLIGRSVCGVEALEMQGDGKERPATTLQCIEMLREIHELVELRQDSMVDMIREKERRFKRSQIQPLYARGDIKQMKTLERNFEGKEKESVCKVLEEKADRIAHLVRICEEGVVKAVESEQTICDKILAAVQSFNAKTNEDKEVLKRAGETFRAVKEESKALLGLFHALELELHDRVLAAEIANAKAEGNDPARLKELEMELKEGRMKLEMEWRRRVKVLEGDVKEFEGILRDKCTDAGTDAGTDGGRDAGRERGDSVEEERERRLRAALEEAKRRNGEV